MGTVFWYQGVPHRAPDVGLSKHRDDADRLRLCLWARPKDTCVRDPTAGHVWGASDQHSYASFAMFHFYFWFPRRPSAQRSSSTFSFILRVDTFVRCVNGGTINDPPRITLSHLWSFISSKNVHRSTLFFFFLYYFLIGCCTSRVRETFYGDRCAIGDTRSRLRTAGREDEIRLTVFNVWRAPSLLSMYSRMVHWRRSFGTVFHV